MPSPRSVLESRSNGFQADGLTCIVLGAGVAGVLSAHVACRHFDSVTLIDADSLDGQCTQGTENVADNVTRVAKQRRGIPQLNQPHTLAMGGLRAMEALLPGFEAELVRRGGVPLDLGRDLHFYDFGDVYARPEESSLKSVGASRPLIQSTLQDELVKRNGDKLTLMGGCRVSGLVWNEDKTVTGVELHSGEKLSADLVIVACGRTSCLPQWLKAAGHPVPPTVKADARLTYVGRMYRIPEDWDEKRWLGSICLGRPHVLWGAGMVPVEDRTWQMVAWGYNGLVPPMDEQGFMDVLKGLPDTEIYEAVCRAEPLSPLCKYGGAYNVQRNWDAVPPPPGIIAIGDCVQALNPVYAQGMSVASQSVLALDEAMSAAIPAGPKASVEARRAAVRRMTPAFQKKLAGVIAVAWMMATSEDLRYPGTKREGVSPPPKIVSRYIDTLCKLCHRDPKVMTVFFEVSHLVQAPSALFHPRLVLSVVGQLLREALAAVWPSSKPATTTLKNA